MDLANYNMHIVDYDGNYYIPLYLANLLFTGSYINVYEMNNTIYLIDDTSDFDELAKDFTHADSFNMQSIASIQTIIWRFIWITSMA